MPATDVSDTDVLEAQRIVQLLGRTHRAMMVAFEQQLGHSLPRWRILLALHQSGELSQKALTKRLGVDPAALTRQIKAMEGQGWLVRHNDPRDNRLTNVALSEAGEALVAETWPRRNAFMASVLGKLSGEDQRCLGDILERLERDLQARIGRQFDAVPSAEPAATGLPATGSPAAGPVAGPSADPAPAGPAGRKAPHS